MFERCLYFNTNALARKLSSHWEDAYSQFDLAAPHAYLLKLVIANPGLSQQEMAEKLQLNKSTVTRFISSLEKKDLLTKGDSSTAARGNTVQPTEQALKIHKDLEATRNKLYAEIGEEIGDEKLEVFIQVARMMNTKLQKL